MTCPLRHRPARLEWDDRYLAVPLDQYPCAVSYGLGAGRLGNFEAFLDREQEAPAFLADHPDITSSTPEGGSTGYTSVARLVRIPDRRTTMSMSKQDFEGVAAVLAQARADHTDQWPVVDSVTEAFADLFTAANPRFDRARFLTACGMGSLKIERTS